MKTPVCLVSFAVAALLAAAVDAAEVGLPDLMKKLDSQDEAVRLEAIGLLSGRGAAAAEAVPALTGLLEDESPLVRAHAARALGRIGKPATPAVDDLGQLITDPDPLVCRAAVSALAEIRPGPKVSVPIFVKVLEEADHSAKLRALHALADLGGEVSPFLIEALKNPKASYWACLIVSEIGPEAEATVPALVELLDDPRPELRREAMLALAAIGPASAPAVPALAKALDDEINQVAATYALGRIGQAPPETEAKIEQNAQSDEGVLGTISLWTLAKLHPEDTDRVGRAVKSLAEALKDPDPERRKAAANALVDLKADPQLVMPILQKTMDNASPEALAAIMDALAGLGEQAVPRLAAALKVQTARLRAAAILALMGPVAAPAVAALDEALADEDAATRTEVLMALAAIGPDAAAAVPTITSLLNAEEMNVRYAATYALGKIGSPAAAAKDELVKNLSAEDEFLPAASAWALSQIDPQSAETAAEAVPVLIQALEASEATTQIQAIEALGRFGPLAKKALPALEKLTEAPDEDLRTVAGNSIRLISAPAGAAPEPSAGKEITAGMTVVAAEDGAVLRGDDREIAKVPPGSRLEVLKIEAGWIGVKATVDGQTVTGWVQPAELKAP